jgi:hypothetical protein
MQSTTAGPIDQTTQETWFPTFLLILRVLKLSQPPDQLIGLPL